MYAVDTCSIFRDMALASGEICSDTRADCRKLHYEGMQVYWLQLGSQAGSRDHWPAPVTLNTLEWLDTRAAIIPAASSRGWPKPSERCCRTDVLGLQTSLVATLVYIYIYLFLFSLGFRLGN